jgi:hypothetical protein
VLRKYKDHGLALSSGRIALFGSTLNMWKVVSRGLCFGMGNHDLKRITEGKTHKGKVLIGYSRHPKATDMALFRRGSP